MYIKEEIIQNSEIGKKLLLMITKNQKQRMDDRAGEKLINESRQLENRDDTTYRETEKQIKPK